MGTKKPGPPASGSLADFPFNDGFWISFDHKNNFTELYELDLKCSISLSPVIILLFLVDAVIFESFYLLFIIRVLVCSHLILESYFNDASNLIICKTKPGFFM